MKPSLKPGLKHKFAYKVPANRTVPHLYPEAADFQKMPHVFATGYFVGVMEWACIDLMAPHMEAGEGSLGVHINISHAAATPPGLTISVDAECTAIDGKRLTFKVQAHDGVDLIGEGTHERYAVIWDKFNSRVADKAAKAGAA